MPMPKGWIGLKSTDALKSEWSPDIYWLKMMQKKGIFGLQLCDALALTREITQDLPTLLLPRPTPRLALCSLANIAASSSCCKSDQ